MTRPLFPRELYPAVAFLALTIAHITCGNRFQIGIVCCRMDVCVCVSMAFHDFKEGTHLGIFLGERDGHFFHTETSGAKFHESQDNRVR